MPVGIYHSFTVYPVCCVLAKNLVCDFIPLRLLKGFQMFFLIVPEMAHTSLPRIRWKSTRKSLLQGFFSIHPKFPDRDLKIRRRRVSTTAVASWGGMRRGHRCEVWKITLRTLVEDAVGFITGFRFFSENMASFRERSNLLLESFDEGGGGFPRTNSFFFKVQTPRKTQISLRRRHDSSMLPESGLLRDLERHGFSTTRESMAVYGDPAYPRRVHLQFPYIGAGITPLLLWSVA